MTTEGPIFRTVPGVCVIVFKMVCKCIFRWFTIGLKLTIIVIVTSYKEVADNKFDHKTLWASAATFCRAGLVLSRV